MNRTLSLPFTIAGALAADHTFTFTVPFDCQIIHVSMSNSSANAGTLELGTAADPDGYLDGKTFGVSGACTEIDTFSEFDGALAASQFPHLPADTVLHLTIKDHASHMADPCVVLTLTEG